MSRWPGNAQKERTTFGGLRRGELMSRVRSTGTQTTEKRLVFLLRAAGVAGWRRHQLLFGRPDFVWPQHKLAVFVDGCFWHGHDCGRNLTARTNAKAWREKIKRNQVRDCQSDRLLRRHEWSVVRIWECQLARNPSQCVAGIRRAFNRRGQAIRRPGTNLTRWITRPG